MKKILAAFTILLMLSGCATLNNPGLGTVGDAATTYYALEFKNATELNPLLSWGNPATAALGSIGLKWAAKEYIPRFTGSDHPHHQIGVDTSVETAGVFATAFNSIGAIGGAALFPAFTGGVVIAAAYWYWKDAQYREAQENSEILLIEEGKPWEDNKDYYRKKMKEMESNNNNK